MTATKRQKEETVEEFLRRSSKLLEEVKKKRIPDKTQKQPPKETE